MAGTRRPYSFTTEATAWLHCSSSRTSHFTESCPGVSAGFREAMAERLGVMAELERSTPLFRFTHGLEPVEAARRLLFELEAAS